MGASGFDFASPKDVMAEVAKLTPSYGGISYERLEELGFLQWPCPTPDHPGTPYLHKGKFSRGLGHFHAIEFKEPAELPDEEYPFTLTTGRLMFHFHTGTMTRRSEKLDQEVPEAYVEIHPDDAAKIGLNGGTAGARLQPARADRTGRAGHQAHQAGHRLHPVPLCRGGGQCADQRRD